MSPHEESFRAALGAWRALPHEVQEATIGAARPDRDPDPALGRVRVGLWAPSLIQGGAERWQESLARNVDPARVAWAGCCVTGGIGRAVAGPMGSLGRWMPISAGPAESRAVAGSCDVLVSWAGVDPRSILSRLARRPWSVYVAHTPVEASGGVVPSWLAHFDVHVAVSELCLTALPESVRSRAWVIPHGLDLDRLEPTESRAGVRARWGVPDGAVVVLFLGRLSREKDPWAGARLAGSDPSVHVVLAGPPGPGTGDIVPTGNLHRVGPIQDVGSALRAADWVLVPSWFESWGYTLAEAWGAGVPVLATCCGIARLYPGLTRPIRVGASGAEIRQALDRDRSDPAGTRERVARARAFARSNFTAERFGRTWTSLLCWFRDREIRAQRAALRLRQACEDGSREADCSCSDYLICKRNHGIRGYASPADCLACLTADGLIDPGPGSGVRIS